MKQVIKSILAVIGIIVVITLTVVPISASTITITQCTISEELFMLSSVQLFDEIDSGTMECDIYRDNINSIEIVENPEGDLYINTNLNSTIGISTIYYDYDNGVTYEFFDGQYDNTYYREDINTIGDTKFIISDNAVINNLNCLVEKLYATIETTTYYSEPPTTNPTEGIVTTYYDINNNQLANHNPDVDISEDMDDAWLSNNTVITIYECESYYIRYSLTRDFWYYCLPNKAGTITTFDGEMEEQDANGGYELNPICYDIAINSNATLNYIDIIPDGTFTLSIDETSSDYINGYNIGKSETMIERYEAGILYGYNQGYTAGRIDGTTDGYSRGKAQGIVEGLDSGLTRGYNTGYEEGYDEGQNDGYTSGYNTGINNSSNYNMGYQIGYEQGFNSVVQVSDGNAVSGFFTGIFGSIYDGYNTITNGITISGLSLKVIISTIITLMLFAVIARIVIKFIK